MYTIQNVQVYNQIGSSCAFLGLARLKITAILSHFGHPFSESSSGVMDNEL